MRNPGLFRKLYLDCILFIPCSLESINSELKFGYLKPYSYIVLIYYYKYLLFKVNIKILCVSLVITQNWFY